MLLLVVALQAVLVLLVLWILLRKPAAPTADERLQRLPEELAALNARLDSANAATRDLLGELRREHAEAAQRHQTASLEAGSQLRKELWDNIEKLSKALNDGLSGFRTDNARGADQLREQVHTTLREIDARLQNFARETQLAQDAAREILHGKLNELGTKNQQSHEALRESVQGKLTGLGEEQRQHHDRLREGVQERLDKLNQANAAKLEEMRVTVDEKLNSTLNERLTASFGQVSEHLGQVQKGLGEMREFATGVNDLKKVFSSAPARGSVGEFQLEMQLKQMFSPEQYECKVQIKKGSPERVEFALRIPAGDSYSLLAIDAKFPLAAWERLEHAREQGVVPEQAVAAREFERAIRGEAKKICEKYIDPPTTVPFGIMFLPTEALYAEVVRRPGLQAELHSECNVMVTGPSSLMALLTSLQFGFRTLAIQKKGNEVWNVLGRAKTEFQNFEKLIEKAEDNVEKVQKTFGEIGVRTRAITRNLRSVSELPMPEENAALLAAETFAGVPLLDTAKDG